ncbi:uncharacterized protein CLUP02_03254 [Colletotrichum lupini]|uniref:Uncharacterized protein n=1 Tax=Colletotrichum lupini TaxID=145971 RepID=A0A9Q8WBM3_9PEZI|nr:uncharacterized protein CLUP02_03254 [Colletotrichum lupini]UQC77783.1 hypothetical protein CLUP02_03254 [Colletotrichum lupini]
MFIFSYHARHYLLTWLFAARKPIKTPSCDGPHLSAWGKIENSARQDAVTHVVPVVGRTSKPPTPPCSLQLAKERSKDQLRASFFLSLVPQFVLFRRRGFRHPAFLGNQSWVVGHLETRSHQFAPRLRRTLWTSKSKMSRSEYQIQRCSSLKGPRRRLPEPDSPSSGLKSFLLGETRKKEKPHPFFPPWNKGPLHRIVSTDHPTPAWLTSPGAAAEPKRYDAKPTRPFRFPTLSLLAFPSQSDGLRSDSVRWLPNHTRPIRDRPALSHRKRGLIGRQPHFIVSRQGRCEPYDWLVSSILKPTPSWSGKSLVIVKVCYMTKVNNGRRL